MASPQLLFDTQFSSVNGRSLVEVSMENTEQMTEKELFHIVPISSPP